MDSCRNQLSPHTHPHAAQEPKTQPSVGYGGPVGNPPRGNPSDDVVFCVGKRRQAYHVNADSLMRGSAYFRNLLQHSNPRGGNGNRVYTLDCDEFTFENMLLLVRYGTFEALPSMSAAKAYQLKKEADFYGITYAEPYAPRQPTSSDSSSEVSGTSSPRSAASGSPRSTMNLSPPPTPRGHRTFGRNHQGARVVCSTPRRDLAELPEFPLDLADPGRLVLVSCLDADKRKLYTCDCSGSGATEWALNFHHRHAFCTTCGGAPKLSAKHFADMFMAAAAHYSTEQSTGAVQATKWRVGCDSTCLLRFVSSAGDGPDACGCNPSAEKEAPPTVWAASSYYSHAFCTRCSEAAEGPILLSLLLALRYGGGKRGSKSARSALTNNH